jgi:hypothetical protein
MEDEALLQVTPLIKRIARMAQWHGGWRLTVYVISTVFSACFIGSFYSCCGSC